MAYCFFMVPDRPSIYPRGGTSRRQSTPMAQPPTQQSDTTAKDIFGPSSRRNDSILSSVESSPPSPGGVGDNPLARRNSDMAPHHNPSVFDTPSVRTRSIPGVLGSAGVVFERDESPLSDDDVIIVTVRLTNKFRKSSVDGSDDLPSRPPRRSFMRRLSTRVSNSWDHAAEKEERYKALKMPRGEYKRHFRRDKDGNYVGTEPEREWDEEQLMREYAEYQHIPLHSITF